MSLFTVQLAYYIHIVEGIHEKIIISDFYQGRGQSLVSDTRLILDIEIKKNS